MSGVSRMTWRKRANTRAGTALPSDWYIPAATTWKPTVGKARMIVRIAGTPIRITSASWVKIRSKSAGIESIRIDVPMDMTVVTMFESRITCLTRSS
jgi:hypothetical protein